MTVLLILIVTPTLNKIDASWEDLNQGGIPPLFDILLQLLQWTFMLVFGCFCPYFARLLKLIVIFWPIFSCPNKTKSNLIIRKIVCKNLYFQANLRLWGTFLLWIFAGAANEAETVKCYRFMLLPRSPIHICLASRRGGPETKVQFRDEIIVFEKVPSAAA